MVKTFYYAALTAFEILMVFAIYELTARAVFLRERSRKTGIFMRSFFSVIGNLLSTIFVIFIEKQWSL